MDCHGVYGEARERDRRPKDPRIARGAPTSKFPRAPFVPYIRGVMAPSWFRKQKKSNLARGAPRSTQEDPGATWNTKKEAGGPYRHPGGSRRSSEDQGSARRTPQDPRGLIKEQSFRSKKIPNNTIKGP